MIKAKITITIDHEGTLAVDAPMHDKLTCYALLEGARDEVRKKFDEMQAGQKIEAATKDQISRLALNGR